MAFVANVTLRTKAIGNPFEIPLRLSPCAFACSGKAFDPQKFDAGFALAQDDTLTENVAQTRSFRQFAKQIDGV